MGGIAIYFAYESPKFLFYNKEYDKAERILKEIARFNGVDASRINM